MSSGKSIAKGGAQSPNKAKSGSAAAKAQANSIAAQAARNLGSSGFVPNKIFIGGIPTACSEEQFRSYFEQFGPISKAELHALRGFGYITYESVESADACLEKYEEIFLCRKWVDVKRSIPRELMAAYESEVRRLTAELAGADGGEKPSATAAPPSVQQPAAAPTVSNTALPSATVASASRRAGPGQASREAPGAGFGNLSRIAQLRDMGFSEAVAKRALSACAWDVNAALDKLLASGCMPGDEGEGDEPETDAAVADTVEETVEESAGAEQFTEGLSAHIDHAEDEDDADVPAPTPYSSGRGAGAWQSPGGKGVPQTSAAPAVHGGSSLADKDSGVTTARPRDKASAASPTAVSKNAAQESATPARVDEAAKVAEFVVGPSTTTPPRKRIERVSQSWTAEAPTQLSVSEKEFVTVWWGTETAHGWVHAEGHEDTSRAGWLPLCVLRPLPEGHRWMQAVQNWKAMDESQCSVATGAMVIVWVSSRTPEGWTYAETEQDGENKPGWLPVFCLAWTDE